jgi:hypothetical protein
LQGGASRAGTQHLSVCISVHQCASVVDIYFEIVIGHWKLAKHSPVPLNAGVR